MTFRSGSQKLNMSATLEVIDSHLADLEVTVGGLVNAISNDCCSKEIISKDVCKSLTKSTKPKRERSKTLMSHVRNCIREDDSKAELFILILSKYTHCQGLVNKIRKHQADIEDRAKIGQAKDSSSKSVILLPAQKSPRKRLPKSLPSQCTDKTNNGNSIKLGITTGACLNPGALGHYNTKMELAELEAKLNDVQEQNKKLEAEKKVVQDRCNAIQREKSTLEREFQLKEQEIDNL